MQQCAVNARGHVEALVGVAVLRRRCRRDSKSVLGYNVRNVDWVQRRVVSVRPVLEPRNRFSVHSITGGCLIFGCVGGALEMSSDWSGSAAYALRPAYL